MRAFLLTPREEFVTAENLDRAYEWHHLNIGFGVRSPARTQSRA